MTNPRTTRDPLAVRTRCQSILALAVLTAACTGGDDQQQRKKRRPRPMVETALVEIGSLTERLELTGSIEPTRFARMASPVEGPVIACPVREADRVRPGQLLVRLGRTKGDDAAVAAARGDLDRKELELGRIEKLVETGALPGEALDDARVKVSEARARLARATEKLGDYRVSAPWAGVVSRVHVAVGDFVAARAPLVELFDPASLLLRLAVPEGSATRVKKGAPITVTLDAHPGRTFTAKVTRIYPEIDRRTHTRVVEGTLDDGVALTPGMFARLQLTLATVRDALTVPVEAVVRRGGNPVVFVIASDGTVSQRPVELGVEVDGRVQLLAGADKGVPVAIAGHNRLREGMKVRVAAGRRDRDSRGRPGATRGRGKAR